MQGTSLRADDSRIDALAPTHAVAVRALLAEPSFETRNERAASLLAELGLTPVPPQRYSLRAIGEPKPWSEPEGRLLALLAEVEIDLAHYPMYSVPSWVRRWLGLEPAGALFARLDDGRTRLEALRAAQEDDHAFEALIASFPVADRLEILVDLLDGDQDFAGAVEDLLQRTIESLDGSAGPWARAQAERTGTAGTLGREQALREQAIFLALVRAKIAIEPEWDALVPLVFGSYVGWIMEECVRAIPAERRAAAVVARLERCDPHVGRPRLVALAALELVPEPAIARWVYARRNEHPKPQEITDHLRALGKDHPAILAVLTEPVAPPRFSVALVPVEPLDSAAAQQLEVASTRYDGKKRRAAAILAGDDDDEAIVPSTIRRIALTENGGRAYDAWTYMGDTATVFVAGTTEVVAEVVQGGLECRDAELKGELRTALAEAGELERSSRKTPTKAKAPPKPAVKKTKEPSAKKTTETSPAKKAKRATTTTSKKAPKKKR